MSETVSYFRDWRFDRTKGTIEGLHEIDPERAPFQHCRLVFDESGRLVRLEEHRQEYALPAIKLFGYVDAESDHIAEALDYNPEGSMRLIHRYQYDELGRMVNRDELSGQEIPRGHVTSTWDEAGHEVEECAYLPDGKMHSRHRYEYDESGNLVREQVFDGNDTLEGTREMDFDGRANVVEKRWFSADGTLQTRYVHTFDEESRIVRSDLFGADGERRVFQDFAYDDFGNPMDPAVKKAMLEEAAQEAARAAAEAEAEAVAAGEEAAT